MVATSSSEDPPRAERRRPLAVLLDVLRGAVIGAVEIVPGVSGGTLALVLGVYETLIESAGELVRGVVRAVEAVVRRTGMERAREHLSRVRWGVLIPLGIGMLAAIVVVSATLAPLIEEHPVETRAVFAGLIVASIAVPARMVGRWGAPQVLAAALAAGAAFWLTSLTGVERADPALWAVVASASIAICALVLPGVSGSFVLLVLGMYAPTLAAVNDRDLAYLGAFVVGAVIGLSLFVTGLEWLLEHRHSLTLAAMTGLMIGSLRALWPWQDDGALLAPSGDVGLVVALFLAGVATVVAIMLAERAARRRALGAADAEPSR